MGMRGTDSSQEYSEAMAAVIDEEVATFIHAAHQEAFDVLEENRDVLDELVRQLFEKETLNKAEVAEVFAPLRRREKRPAWTGSENRIPSQVPPVEVPPAPERPTKPRPVAKPAAENDTQPQANPAPGPDSWAPPQWPPAPKD